MHADCGPLVLYLNTERQREMGLEGGIERGRDGETAVEWERQREGERQKGSCKVGFLYLMSWLLSAGCSLAGLTSGDLT